MFINLLLIFAIGHFNFQFNETETFDFFNLNNNCNFKEWYLNIQNIEYNNIYGTTLTFSKDKQYTICIIYNDVNELEEKNIKEFKNQIKANEYKFASYDKYEEIFAISSILHITSCLDIN